MVACTASPGKLIAAPFAVVGSIGVIGQSFNIHKTLEGWGIRSLVFRGGKDKAPVGLVGEITEEGMEKVQQMVDDTHKAFKRHVAEARPVIAEQIDEYATGQVWLGYDAEKAGLVDRLSTTDEYLDERMLQGAKILRLARLAAPRYPFGPPVTTLSATTETRPSLVASVNAISTSLRSLVTTTRQLMDWLGTVDRSINM